MALTPSNMLELGTKAPDFTLPDTVSGAHVALDELKGEQGTVIMFICNHCPYVKHVNSELVRSAHNYQSQGIAFIAISSNDVKNYPQDSPDNMRKVAAEQNYPFPYLYDETQEVAKSYQAACTPDLYLFDKDLQLFYRGQLDGSRPGNNIPVSGKDLRKAMDQLINGEEAPVDQIPSVGCNIKWK